MKKKLISLAMLVTVFAMQVVGVSAASKTTDMAVAGDSKAYYEAQEMPESMLEQVAAQNQEYADLIKEINAGTKTLADLAKVAPELAGQLDGMTLITSIEDVIPVNGGNPQADGHHVTLSVPTLTKGMSDVKVLHYSLERKTWELITPSNVDVTNKQLDVVFKDLSPVGIVAKVDVSQAVTNTSGTSPKTGVEVNNTWAGFGVTAVVLLSVAVVVLRRKRA